MGSISVGFDATSAQAQIFKWTDEKGITHLSDQPPPPNAKKVEQKNISSVESSVSLPYELAEAVRNFPVTIFTTANCSGCDQGRKLLQTRGVPFTEKTISTEEDSAKLAEAGSDGQLPFLLVGNQKLIGFEAGGWTDALNNANYPAKRVLPANYKQAQAETAARRAPSPEQAKAKADADRAAAAAARAEANAAAAEAAKRKADAEAKPDFQF